MRQPPKPIRVFYSKLTGRFYATCTYKIDDKGVVTVTGQKFDVTNDIAGLIEQNGVTFTKRDEPPNPSESPSASAIKGDTP